MQKALARKTARTQLPEEYKDQQVWRQVKERAAMIMKSDGRGNKPDRYVLNRPWRGDDSYVIHTNNDAPGIIEQKLRTVSGRKIRVLDTSAGYGTAMGGLKQEYGERIYVTTCSLTKSVIAGNADERRIGLFECQRFSELFDVVFDIFGAVHHGLERAVIIQQVIANLAPTGVAYVTLPFVNGWNPANYVYEVISALNPFVNQGMIILNKFSPKFKPDGEMLSGNTFRISKMG